MFTQCVLRCIALPAQELSLRYLGTIAPREGVAAIQQQDAIEVQSPPAELRRQTWHLQARVRPV